MKLTFRIYFILGIISTLTIVLLTVLMHFRYHITRAGLVHDRIGTTTSGIVRSIDNYIRLGIEIDSLKNINNLITRAKSQESIINNIFVAKISKGTMTILYKTGTEDLQPAVQARTMQVIKGSKGLNWHFDAKNGERLVGVTLKDPAGFERGAIIVTYSDSVLKKQEEKEVNNLYERMTIGLIISIMLSIMIGYTSTNVFVKNSLIIRDTLDGLNQKQKKFDLSSISDPTLRGNLRAVVSTSTKMIQHLQKVEKLCDAADPKKSTGEKI